MSTSSLLSLVLVDHKKSIVFMKNLIYVDKINNFRSAHVSTAKLNGKKMKRKVHSTAEREPPVLSYSIDHPFFVQQNAMIFY